MDGRVGQARYDWLQLHAWHEQAWPAALSVEGAVLSDSDEGSNRLRFGGVDAAAVSAIGATYVRRCQARVAAGVGGGDSGSPVFAATNRRGNPNSGRVILAGILWAGALDGTQFIYSPTFNIERDLGLLQTH